MVAHDAGVELGHTRDHQFCDTANFLLLIFIVFKAQLAYNEAQLQIISRTIASLGGADSCR